MERALCTQPRARRVSGAPTTPAQALLVSVPAAPRRRSTTVRRRSPASWAARATAEGPAATAPAPPPPAGLAERRAAAKARLLAAVAGTRRGAAAGSAKRGEVEEAQVALEALAGVAIDWDLLAGVWDVAWTTARDVAPLVGASAGAFGLPGLSVGRVGQTFLPPAEGRVQNVIEVELAGATARLVVDAAYEIRTARSVALRFEAAGVEGVELSSAVQNLLAPALLPRGWWNQRALVALETLALRVPLATPAIGAGPGGGVNYVLTYLDAEVLVGRASNGAFVFQRRAEREGGEQ
jgi:hypothetical protein